MQLFIKAFIISLIFITSSTYANCPPTNQVKYGCSTNGGKKHCNWRAPWYEGFTEQAAEPNDVAESFTMVYWGTTNNAPKPGNNGSSVCFFKSPHGHTIELVQNVWGGVAYPTDSHWTDDVWQGHHGRGCGHGASQSDCHFEYPA